MSFLKKLFGSGPEPQEKADMFLIIRRNDMQAYDKAIGNANLTLLDDYNRNLLFEAITHGNEYVALNLIERNINVDVQDKDGNTVLHFCAEYSNYNVAKAILDRGAKVNLRDKHGNNPLWTAVFNGQKTKDYRIVKLLLSHGADAHNANNVDKSPLDFAWQVGYLDLIGILEGR